MKYFDLKLEIRQALTTGLPDGYPATYPDKERGTETQSLRPGERGLVQKARC